MMRRRKVEVGEQVMSGTRRTTHQPRRSISKEWEWKEKGMVMEVCPGMAPELKLLEELLEQAQEVLRLVLGLGLGVWPVGWSLGRVLLVLRLATRLGSQLTSPQDRVQEVIVGSPPTRFIEMYLAGIVAAAEEEVKQSPSLAREALQGPHGSKWQEAMDAEMESLRVNGVYELVDRPARKKVVKSKWVLRVKANERGEVEKYKARVVEKYFSQVEGVDYD